MYLAIIIQIAYSTIAFTKFRADFKMVINLIISFKFLRVKMAGMIQEQNALRFGSAF